MIDSLLERFDVSESLAGRTTAGNVWVRFGRTRETSGWFAVGSRPPSDLKDSEERGRFWHRAYATISLVANQRIDAAHAGGPGELSISGLGLTLVSGEALTLLASCMNHDPFRFMEVMAPALFASGVYLSRGELTRGVTDGWFLCRGTTGRVLDGSGASARIVRNKKAQRLWVTGISRLLRDDRFDGCQLSVLRGICNGLFTDAVRTAVGWPSHTDMWGWTEEQQAVWAVALGLLMDEPVQATKLLEQTSRSTSAADRLQRIRSAAMRFEYDEVFERRAAHLLDAAEIVFGLKS